LYPFPPHPTQKVSDGIIAPGFEPEALEILKSKKGGKFIVLQVDADYEPPEFEYREIYGVCFKQKRNDIVFTRSHLDKRVTNKTELSESAIRDLLVASIAIKYTQSNSVGYAFDGQMIGVGAGQQSRVDCVKLAGTKLETWYLRQHPKVLALKFKDNLKRVDRTNARIQYIEGDFTDNERKAWESLFEQVPEPLSASEKSDFLQALTGVSIASDAFFPFRDNIDQASKRGVSYIAQPGGSVQDEAVIAAADEYNMVMAFTGVRLFHH
jgi:phosphoribosylaminoimidazolecarboxamide formyltransferase / IMP cyclohydrolase